MIYAMFGALVLGCATGVAAERFGFTRNGYLVSAALGVGGALLFVTAQWILGLSFGLGRAASAIVGAAILLALSSRRRR